MAIMTSSQARENFLAALDTLRSAKVRSALTILASSSRLLGDLHGGHHPGSEQVRAAQSRVSGSRHLFRLSLPARTDPSRWPESIRIRKYFEYNYGQFHSRRCAAHPDRDHVRYARLLSSATANQITYEGSQCRKGHRARHRTAIHRRDPTVRRRTRSLHRRLRRGACPPGRRLGAAINESLFPYEDAVGKTVRINGQLYEVVESSSTIPACLSAPALTLCRDSAEQFRKNYPEAKELILAFTVPENVNVETAQTKSFRPCGASVTSGGQGE